MESLALIDLLRANDSLLSPGIDCDQKGEDLEEPRKQTEFLELLDSLKSMDATTRKFKPRESLTWDNILFTSEGVLNSEELAILNSTFRSVEPHTLHVSDEDIRKLTDLNSIFDNQSWELEKLESTLFEDLRAATQTSCGKCDGPSSIACSSKAMERERRDARSLGSKKKADITPQTKMKSPMVSKKHDISKQQQKEVSNSKETLLERKMAATSVGGLKVQGKLPSIARRITPKPNESAAKHVQTKSSVKNISQCNAVSQKSYVTARKVVHGNSCSITCRDNSSLRSSSNLPPGKTVMSKSLRSSYSPASNSLVRSSIKTSRNRNDSKITNQLSFSTTETPLRALNIKTRSIDCCNVTTPKSSLKFSSCVSPTSSIDSVVSKSSSLTSSASKQSYSTESFDVASSTSSIAPFDFDIRQPSVIQQLFTDQSFSGLQNSDMVSQTQHIARIHSETHSLTEASPLDCSKSRIRSKTAEKCCKPSGLRMPTPKIGYFDVENIHVKQNKIFSSRSATQVTTDCDTQHALPVRTSNCTKSESPGSRNWLLKAYEVIGMRIEKINFTSSPI